MAISMIKFVINMAIIYLTFSFIFFDSLWILEIGTVDIVGRIFGLMTAVGIYPILNLYVSDFFER